MPHPLRSTAAVLVFVAAAWAFVALPGAQAPAGKYPPATKGTVVDNYFGTKVADPYRWMEELDSPDVKSWVEAENAVTFKYLDTLPARDELRKRITELWNYPKVSTPSFEGGRWFYSRNSGLQRQSVVYWRESLGGGADNVAIDPNEFSPDGSIALSGFVPSPDGKHFAYGQSEGGSDWSTYRVRTLPDGKPLTDEIRWVKFSGLSWTKDGKGFFYGRYPEPAAGKALQQAVRDKKIYYHVLGTPQSADRLVYERPEEPTLFISAGVDETRRYLFLVTNKGTSNKNELFVKDLGDALEPEDRRAGRAALHGPHRAVRSAWHLERRPVPDDRPRRAEQEDRLGADRQAGPGELEDARACGQVRDPGRQHGGRQDRGQRARGRGEHRQVLRAGRHPGPGVDASEPRRDRRAERPLRARRDLLHLRVAALPVHRVPLRRRRTTPACPSSRRG